MFFTRTLDSSYSRHKRFQSTLRYMAESTLQEHQLTRSEPRPLWVLGSVTSFVGFFCLFFCFADFPGSLGFLRWECLSGDRRFYANKNGQNMGPFNICTKLWDKAAGRPPRAEESAPHPPAPPFTPLFPSDCCKMIKKQKYGASFGPTET